MFSVTGRTAQRNETVFANFLSGGQLLHWNHHRKPVVLHSAVTEGKRAEQKKKINNKKDKVYQESIKTDNDQDFQDNRYNPEQLFFEISSYNNLKRKIINELTWKEELVFTMREQNFTIEEISQVTDNCIKTVYNIINRIKKKVSNLCKIS